MGQQRSQLLPPLGYGPSTVRGQHKYHSFLCCRALQKVSQAAASSVAGQLSRQEVS